MIRVLHIVAGVWKESGGLATVVLGFAKEQAHAGHGVTLAFLEGDRHSGLAIAEQEGVKVVTFKRSWPYALYFSWGMLFKLAKTMKDADVVHVHSNWTFPVWWGAWLALRHQKTLVMSPHGCLDPVRLKHSGWKKAAVGWIDRGLLRRASVVHATCEEEKRWVQAFLKLETGSAFAMPTADKYLKLGGALRAESPRIVVIPNGVEKCQ